MFVLRWTEEASAEYARLKAKAEAALSTRRKRSRSKNSQDEGLFKQVHKCVSLTGLSFFQHRHHTCGIS